MYVLNEDSDSSCGNLSVNQRLYFVVYILQESLIIIITNNLLTR